MASGSIVGGGGDGSRDKHRWGDGKVYTRKAHNKGSENAHQRQPSQTAAIEDGNTSQQQLLTRFDAASDDSSSLNRRQSAAPNSPEPPSGNGSIRAVFPRLENGVTINLSSRSKQEMRELRRKLANELDQVRTLVKKLEAREVQYTGFSGSGYSHSQLSTNDAADNCSTKRINSEVGSVGHHELRPLHQLSVSVVENSQGVSDVVEKEKRTPKANQYYRNSDFVLGKEKFPPPDSHKKSKSNGKKRRDGEYGFQGFGVDKYSSQVFKSCSNLLAKLMKHKHGWVFNTPVDVKGLGLHDYYTIIKHPMDLGTVKSRLLKNRYKSPWEIAEDVRLTFRNAMTYNPKGQDVYVMAEQLLKIFEDNWTVVEAELNLNSRFGTHYDAALPTRTWRKALPPPLHPEMRRTLDRLESTTPPVDSNLKPSNFAPPGPGRTPAPKKPKAKDPHKRDMTYEEKQRLSTNLQSLPSEKLDNIVQIIKKRNSSLCQHDDEIEVDIDSVDAETLWELDRFVTNYKKSLSKYKRKAELAIQARAEAEHNVQEMNPVTTMIEAPTEPKRDEKIVSSFSPVQAEKQGDNASRSSSSSSSSSDSGSSSSDSDSESSSAFGSDVGHSPRT
ncbi:transcription factor GTE4-like [Telopea speciosissima]|uniref:transcription factor GTE4-like n=1 Tax=Telopea speciosissima TaxID=54955 RepID=UPI001CC41B80|nr:transcription factor GTE4-like [Telopea speciosissima]XP_043699536.1 transcription factor GTE4-like [Telopea speciosissima]XP_043699537.1 transcription factor GTE4-like [Telopea speciosissima]XP_043699538.1 transcription factor GTE4-like [Telopea speciosissima]XP_043699539.1 transcription factor GTE4-like [Telopea speciosissima]XP_043699540.1 transcription factor GTE4-like [Telopea speciosissima]